jgi:hypothetical protein
MGASFGFEIEGMNRKGTPKYLLRLIHMTDMVVDESMALRNWKVSQGADPNNLKVLSMLSGQRPFLNSIVPAGPGKIGSSDKTNAELRNPHNTKLR